MEELFGHEEFDNYECVEECDHACVEEYDYIPDIDPEEEKKRIFELYDDIRNGRRSIEDLGAVDLIIISALLRKERDVLVRKAQDPS